VDVLFAHLSHDAPLISVVIPAYNAAATLEETLDSALAQTHRRIEVVVVDDGSTDGTAAIANAAAARDPRVRVISIPNAGVATARNIGIAATSGAYVAPLDADDLWHPDTLRKQLAALEAAGDRAGFAYAFYRRIDMDGRVLSDGAPRVCTGRVFTRLLVNNFVGNGSGLLMRRAAVDSIGGYDPSLRAMGVGGCEDYLIQVRLAASWTAAATPEFLIGYRITPGAMSSDGSRMHRSNTELLRIAEETTPAAPARAFAIARAVHRVRGGVLHMRNGRLASGLGEILLGLAASPGPGYATLMEQLRMRVRTKLRRGGAAEGSPRRPLFRDMDPASGVRTPRAHPLDRWIAELSVWEREPPEAGVDRIPRSAAKEIAH
jgi:hypothetical protein